MGDEETAVRRPRRSPRGGRSAQPAVEAPPPCGACKSLRRKCVKGCVFAPHFGSEQGAARFAAVHKLMAVPTARRGEAVATVCYEAQARLSDPVYGCVSTILALQQQVAGLHAELSMVQMQLLNTRLVAESAARGSHVLHALQPAYSNNSSASNKLADFSSLHFGGTAAAPRPSGPILRCQPCHADDGDEGDSQDPSAFIDEVFSRKQ
ncbi:unnamed protein product [Spirodela intermedia]|uniref:LOB domain-containing protein n=1 Tax=Spirodela intermedia TaxID=51605 RepID=A0A7I8INP5_SPIIN|nr:unnamed protein product [Spirodela intermedia]CAA6658597.1 unnamed protein product [Spirodela intermedia]